MTTEAEVKDGLSWDTFITLEVDRGRLEGEAKAKTVANIRSHVEAFRVGEWKDIKRHLAEDFKLHAVVEPHWTSSGSAVYWQERRVRERVMKEGEGAVIEWTGKGWETTGPLPADNASQIAHYLEKGFRLRPPSAGVDVEPLESAAPSEEPQGTGEVVAPYKCHRHLGNKYQFVSWKGYMQHCERRQEIPDLAPPVEMLEALRGKEFICKVHWQGFAKRRMAILHLKNRRYAMLHRMAQITIEAMEKRDADEGSPDSREPDPARADQLVGAPA